MHLNYGLLYDFIMANASLTPAYRSSLIPLSIGARLGFEPTSFGTKAVVPPTWLSLALIIKISSNKLGISIITLNEEKKLSKAVPM